MEFIPFPNTYETDAIYYVEMLSIFVLGIINIAYLWGDPILISMAAFAKLIDKIY